MIQLITFTKKEILEQFRNSKILLLIIIFSIFGIMSPAIAKLTPWMMDLLSDQLTESGMIIEKIDVNSLTAWTQFFKNIQMALIIFIIMFSGIFTTEYQKGTLVILISKGLKRWKVIISKFFIVLTLWTLSFLLSFLITFAYSEYFWDNSIMNNLAFANFCFYLFGVWVISIIVLSSTFLKNNSSVILFVGLGFIVSYLLNLIPMLKEYVPTYLMNSGELLLGTVKTSSYTISIIITSLLIIFNIILSILTFNKKSL
ncbi:ABC transporter permease subunit [Miniphocaeibacter massiliensis]|uniref:ABC transporter permease subunit n=1 Tax=Miniphocaeibacter massiliensis TaxID=2041841 RepID=UPI000C1B9284|nr:ABC transporter permease subunit [Miniphocaeibacter massiliensis]